MTRRARIPILVERAGINAFGNKVCKLGHYTGTVFLVGYAEPVGRSGKDLASGFTALDKHIHGIRDIVLLLGLCAVLCKEGNERGLALGEVIRGEAPHVHGAESLGGKLHVFLSADGVVAVDVAVGLLGNVQVFCDSGENVLFVIEADAAGHAAVFREGVLQLETYDAILSGYLLKVRASNMKQYQEFILNKLGTIENLSSLESTFVMSEIKQTYGIHI